MTAQTVVRAIRPARVLVSVWFLLALVTVHPAVVHQAPAEALFWPARWDQDVNRWIFAATGKDLNGDENLDIALAVASPNGIGLSPAGDRLYVAETHTGRLFAWDVPEPGVATGSGLMAPHGELV